MPGKKGTNLGNRNAVKFKTKKQRATLCKRYIDHVQEGFSDESFPECDPQTLRKYMEEYPSDFDTDMVQKARRERLLYWERIGVEGTTGKIKGFNAKSWIFNMQNRAGWSQKHQTDVTSEGKFIQGAGKAIERAIEKLEAYKKKKAAQKAPSAS